MRAGPHPAVATGALACRRGIPARFLRRIRTDHTPAPGQGRRQTRTGSPKVIGKAEPLVIARARPPAHRHRRRRAPVPGSSRTVRKEKHHPPPRTRVRPMGTTCSATAVMAAAVIDRIDPPRTHHQVPRRIPPKHTPAHEITNKQKETNNRPHRPTRTPTVSKSTAEHVHLDLTKDIRDKLVVEGSSPRLREHSNPWHT